jgi:hypothetical protein
MGFNSGLKVLSFTEASRLVVVSVSLLELFIEGIMEYDKSLVWPPSGMEFGQ